MKYVNIQEKEIDVSLNEILDEVTANQSEIVITRNGLPIVKIIPWQTPTKKNYPLRGKPITIPSDFDEPIPELWEVLAE